MAKKTGFILHYDMFENISILGNETAMEILRALVKFDKGQEPGELSPQAQFAFNAYAPALVKAKKTWEKNVRNAGVILEPNESQTEPNESQTEPNESQPEPNESQPEPNESQPEPAESQTAKVDGVNVNVNDNVNENENVNAAFDNFLNNKPKNKLDATAVFNKAVGYWNQRKIPPPCRDLIIPHAEEDDCLRTLQNYTWAEIKNAIANYEYHLSRTAGWKPPPPYGSIYGFIKKGVEKYFDDEVFEKLFKEG